MTRAGRAAARIYRLALRAFPASHRATYADEMVETFAGALSARQREQGLGAFALVRGCRVR